MVHTSVYVVVELIIYRRPLMIGLIASMTYFVIVEFSQSRITFLFNDRCIRVLYAKCAGFESEMENRDFTHSYGISKST
jgi:hypothetical protein